MKQILSLSTITRTVKPGVKGDRANGVAAIKPVTQEVPMGVRFTPLTAAERDELLKMGAAREQHDQDDWDQIPLFKKDGEIEVGKTDEELAEEQRLLDEQTQRRQEAAQRVRDAAAAKLKADQDAAEKQRIADADAAAAEAKRLSDQAAADAAAEQARLDALNNGGGQQNSGEAGEKPKTPAKGKGKTKAAEGSNADEDVV